MYHKEFSQKDSGFLDKNDFVIQIDDYGSFWDPDVAQSALQRIQDSANETNTVVSLFVHGWHHNAEKEDENALDFSSALKSAREQLDDNNNGEMGIYSQSREILTGKSDLNVIGIYVGWRGKVLPMPLNFATFWNRKNAAERVGQGDFKEFIERLNNIYKSHSSVRRERSEKSQFLGMVSFGHSFGGQVLFKAISSTLEKGLIERTSSNTGNEKTEPIEGFGDIAVLINPALEAYQFDRIHRLSQEVEYQSDQVPRLLVLSAQADYARKILFPIGRSIDALFRPRFRKNQRRLWTKALGIYKPQITHEASIVDEGEYDTFDPSWYSDNPCRILEFDLTDTPVAGGVKLTPIKTINPYSPFLVANVGNEIIFRHSGIFKERLQSFLTDYVGFAQGKQILIDSGKREDCKE